MKTYLKNSGIKTQTIILVIFKFIFYYYTDSVINNIQGVCKVLAQEIWL